MKNFTSIASLCVLGAGMALTPQLAFAQDADETAEAPADESRSAIDDAFGVIVVTAQKGQNAEDVQDVPLAVTAFNAASLEALKVRDIQSLTYSAPSVSLDQVGTSRGTANFSIRGLGINSSIPSVDPTVGVFVDGVYLGINNGVVFDVFDLDSVEILRGPQGILFGRNTTGGAVLLNTGNPTEDFRLKVRASYDGPVDSGRGGGNMTMSGVVSGPVIEDVLLFKLGAYYNFDDGYFLNLFNGQNHGQAETTILRGALEFRPSDAITIVGKLDYFESEGDGPASQNHGVFGRDTFDFSIDETGSYTNEILTANLRTDIDVGPGTLTNIFGYREFEGTTNGDIDASPIFFFHSATTAQQEQISNELRYAVDFDPFKLTIGAFYFDQSLDYTETRNLPPVTSATFYGGGTQDHTVYSGFGQAEFSVTDALTLIAGLNYSHEKKTAGITYIIPRAVACSVEAGTCPTTGTNGFTDSNTWSNFSPKLGLQYEFANSQVYASWTRGTRSGGYNFRNTDPVRFLSVIVPATGGNFYFDDEQVDNYELGLKFQTDDRALTLNLAAYYTEISNMQRELNVPSPSGVSQFILNTADVSIKGVEAEGRFRIFDGLVLTGNFGYIDDKYEDIRFDISGSSGVIDADDFALRLPRVPKWTYGVGLLSEIDLGNSEIVTRVNFQHRDRFAYTDNNAGWITASDNLDANITWNTPLEGVALSLYGKNLLDEVQHGGDTQLPFGAGPLSNGVTAPFDPNPAAGTFSPLNKGRVVGIEFTLDFGG
jgi:iron complex outermembrane receptor protein